MQGIFLEDDGIKPFITDEEYEGMCKRVEQAHDMLENYEFYSDSFSDEPLAKIAKKAYIVDRENLTPWEEARRQAKNC